MADQQPNTPPAPVTLGEWEKLERAAKVLSLVAIPVALAFGGWLIQNSLAERSVSQEYVKLAVTILKEPKDKTDNLLRSWAADLLNQNSPTKFSPEVLRALKEGQAVLPAQLAAILSANNGGGSLAVSPDGKRVGTGHTDGAARIWDIATGKLIMELRGHSAAVTALAFSPDATTLLTASSDKTARLWDLRTAREISRISGQTDDLIGAAFGPDGRSFLTRSLDGTVVTWSVDGRLLSRIQVTQ
jgi:WD40 repeat protein